MFHSEPDTEPTVNFELCALITSIPLIFAIGVSHLVEWLQIKRETRLYHLLDTIDTVERSVYFDLLSH